MRRILVLLTGLILLAAPTLAGSDEGKTLLTKLDRTWLTIVYVEMLPQ